MRSAARRSTCSTPLPSSRASPAPTPPSPTTPTSSSSRPGPGRSGVTPGSTCCRGTFPCIARSCRPWPSTPPELQLLLVSNPVDAAWRLSGTNLDSSCFRLLIAKHLDVNAQRSCPLHLPSRAAPPPRTRRLGSQGLHIPAIHDFLSKILGTAARGGGAAGRHTSSPLTQQRTCHLAQGSKW